MRDTQKKNNNQIVRLTGVFFTKDKKSEELVFAFFLCLTTNYIYVQSEIN